MRYARAVASSSPVARTRSSTSCVIAASVGAPSQRSVVARCVALAPRVSNELAPPHLVPARRCIEEIHKYSLCLQTSACPAPLAKATSRATTPRCEGAPTAAAVTQLVLSLIHI